MLSEHYTTDLLPKPFVTFNLLEIDESSAYTSASAPYKCLLPLEVKRGGSRTPRTGAQTVASHVDAGNQIQVFCT